MAVGGTAVIAALTAAGEGDHSRQQQRDGCPDDPWILEQSTHGGERAAGDQDWRGATQAVTSTAAAPSSTGFLRGR